MSEWELAGGRSAWAVNVEARLADGSSCATATIDRLLGPGRMPCVAEATPAPPEALAVGSCSKVVSSAALGKVDAPPHLGRGACGHVNREQRVRRRRWRTKSDWGRGGGRAGSVASKESPPPCQLSSSPVSRRAGKRNFFGWLASRRQIRRRSAICGGCRRSVGRSRPARGGPRAAMVRASSSRRSASREGFRGEGRSIGSGRVRVVRGARKFAPLSGGRRFRGAWGRRNFSGWFASRRQMRSLSENRRLRPTSFRP